MKLSNHKGLEGLRPWLLFSSTLAVIFTGLMLRALPRWTEVTRSAAAPTVFHIVAQGNTVAAQQPSKPLPQRDKARSLAPSAAVRGKSSPSSVKPPRINSSENVQVISARKRAELISRYVAEWISVVERKAQREIRQPLPGQLQLRVIVNKDGALQALDVLSSTTTAEQRLRTVALVRNSSPYLPFPPRLARSADKLVIHADITFTAAQKSIGSITPQRNTSGQSVGALSSELGRALSSSTF
ncbi:MAG: hypothetical protein PHO57_11465 [Acidithiobacillus sp.]|nr:hypothetical protein [Acidithiobacillus sp.]